ncbi:hypothetical protein CERSUDRAFT_144601 [Gelatoporia subvermispora B]|uniref:Cytochrome P450 n=1 Tax=Ceriporiopsis subvermispora (strain B) TaxID=914234 RepID=M2R0K2_CERS8|nr:hypothetical protein CERSUDRAFT_144601 [Gelatoporia subvermispora B]
MNIVPVSLLDCIWITAVIWLVSRIAKNTRRDFRTTSLRGPSNPSWFWGASQLVSPNRETGGIYEQWAKMYGPIYRVPEPLGASSIVVTDPKAAFHVLSQDTWGYTHTIANKTGIENMFGKGLLWVDGERHRMKRKSLTPGFSNIAIRGLTSVYFDSAYKVKAAWDSQIQNAQGDSAIIYVYSWMNHVSLDTIGIAGFLHDFGTLLGKHASVGEVFDRLGNINSTPGVLAMLALTAVFPFLQKIPTERHALLHQLQVSMTAIAAELLDNVRKECNGSVKTDESIIDLLVKAEQTE